MQQTYEASSSVVRERMMRIWRGLEDGLAYAFAWFATTVYRYAGDWRGWRPLLTRTSAHVAIVVVAVAAIGLSTIQWSALAAPIVPVSALPVAAHTEVEQEAADDGRAVAQFDTLNTSAALVAGNGSSLDGSIVRVAQPHTVIPDRPRLGIFTYTVQAGDTVQAIAGSFNLKPTTIMWANPAIEDAPDLLRVGQEVVILPIDGAYHQVSEGDTLNSIADTYEVEPKDILACEYNDVASADDLPVGYWLVIPGGEKPYVPKVVTSYDGPVPEGARGSGLFQWPVLGRITQGYWSGHRAIDIGAPTGSALLASDGGFISFAGWTDVGYGYLVVIDHANGFVTYYAHLSNIYVEKGQKVERGQVIGATGNTGWSTGPHLHFEIRYYSQQLNPRAHLP